MVKLEFKLWEHTVSEGQDPDKRIKDGSRRGFAGSQEGQLMFECGRQGTEKVAQWFNDRVPGSSTTFNHAADDLNFALIGDLMIKLEGKECQEDA